jgi:hypothetical protein
MPSEIIEAAENHKLVIFAGAGISTEGKNIFPTSLYDDVRYELSDKTSPALTFSELMSLYCKKKNGRRQLLTKIRKRIEYVKSFPSLYRFATRFHQQLASIYHIRDIITTNWDDFFEIECGAIPYVTTDDFAFWDIPQRKVFKLHGSINNVGSIIATTEDYNKCYRRLKKDLIGSYLKLALATKTVAFVGYSFADEDFRKLFSWLKKEMREIIPHSFLITTDATVHEKIKTSSMTPIITDGTFFVHKLKNILIKSKSLLSDAVYVDVYKMLEKIKRAHEKTVDELKISKHPNILYTYSYQDGLIDAFQRAIVRINTGEYCNPCNLIQQISLYKDRMKEKRKIKQYFDLSYMEGYVNGLMYFLIKEKDRQLIPLYYLYGCRDDLRSFSSLKKKVNNIYNIDASRKAKLVVSKKTALLENLVLQHQPFL